MAVEIQRMIATLEANFNKYDRALKKALGDTDRTFRKMETRGKAMETSLSRISPGFKGLLGALAGSAVLRGFVQFSDAATRVENSLKVAGLAGADLTRVYDALYASAQKNAAPLESLVDLYSRASQVQKELGITSEELLGFTDKVAVALRVSGKSAAESSGALLQLSQALGSGTVRAEEFNSILEGALPVAQAAAVGLKEAGGSVAKLRQLVIDGKVSSEAFFRAFEAGSVILDEKVATSQTTVAQGFTRLKNALTDAAGEFNKATGASASFGDGLTNLGDIIDGIDFSGFVTKIGDARRAFDGFLARLGNSDAIKFLAEATGDPEYTGTTIEEARAFAARRSELNGLRRDIELTQAIIARNVDLEIDTTEAEAKLAALNRKLVSLKSGITISGEATAASSSAASAGASASATNVATVSLNDFKPPAGDKKTQAEKDAETVRQEQQGIAEYLDTLRAEKELIGASTLEREKSNAVRNLAMSATDAQIDAVEGLIEATYREEEALASMREAQEFFAQNAFASLIDVVDGSKSAEDALKDLAKAFAYAALQAALLGQGPFAGIFGTANPAGGVGGLFGALFGAGKAAGGPVSAGTAYPVGEKGPELFVPGVSGTIIPNHAISKGGGQTAVHVTVGIAADQNGNLTPFVAKVAQSTTAQGLAAYDAAKQRQQLTSAA